MKASLGPSSTRASSTPPRATSEGARSVATNRVLESCRAYGIAEPTFTEGSGAVTVTFRAEIVADLGDLVPGGHQVGTKLGLSRDQVQVLGLAGEPATLPELMAPSGRTNRTKFQDQVVEAGRAALVTARRT